MVDWSYYCNFKFTYFFTGAPYTYHVGVALADQFIEYTKKKDDTPRSIHVIGFSLGAHVAGAFGDAYKSTRRPIDRITGKSGRFLSLISALSTCALLSIAPQIYYLHLEGILQDPICDMLYLRINDIFF